MCLEPGGKRLGVLGVVVLDFRSDVVVTLPQPFKLDIFFQADGDASPHQHSGGAGPAFCDGSRRIAASWTRQGMYWEWWFLLRDWLTPGVNKPVGDRSVARGTPEQHLQHRSSAGRIVIGGHGVVMLPDSPAVKVEDGQESRRIVVGGSAYRVIAGVDTTIDGVPVGEYASDESGQGLGDPELSAGQAAAIAFAKAAERLQREGV